METCLINFLPAKSGDCILLKLTPPHCILIDCGFKDTYTHHLKPLLLQLSSEGYRLSLLIVSHMDCDHIEGAISFLEENGSAETPNIIPVDNIWMNGFFNTLFQRPEFEKRRTAAISERHREKLKRTLKELRMSARDDGQISAHHSRAFETLCAQGGYHVNRQFADGIVKCTATNREDALTAGVEFGNCRVFVLSPSEDQLTRLGKKLNKELIRWFGADYEIQESDEFAEFFENLMKLYEEPMHSEQISAGGINLESWRGTSTLAPMNEINRASIVVEIQIDDRRFLFTGDGESADWDKLLAPDYDLLKLSHHGTTKPNLALLEKSYGKCVLISTNGRANGQHPEDDLLARVILRGTKDLYFNYDIARKQCLTKFQDKYGFTAHFGEKTIIL